MHDVIRPETDDWKLDCFMDWVPKDHQEECASCHGTGKRSVGRMGWIDDDESVCRECNGKGWISRGPRVPKPELPKALLKHMRRAWEDFFDEGEKSD